MSLNQIQQSVEGLNGVRGVSPDWQDGQSVVEIRTEDIETLRAWASREGYELSENGQNPFGEHEVIVS